MQGVRGLGDREGVTHSLLFRGYDSTYLNLKRRARLRPGRLSYGQPVALYQSLMDGRSYIIYSF